MTKYKRLFESDLPPEMMTILVDNLYGLNFGEKGIKLPGPVKSFWKLRIEDEDEFYMDITSDGKKGNNLKVPEGFITKTYKGKKYTYIVGVPKTQKKVLGLIIGEK